MINVIKTKIDTTVFPKPIMMPDNGIELEACEAAQENIEDCIVLCHGFLEHEFSYRPQIPAFATASHHVIVPHRRGYGNLSNPMQISDVEIKNLSGDLIVLLDFYECAIFASHDWAAKAVFRRAQLYLERVSKVINMALPYQLRGNRPWIELMEDVFGEDFYVVYFNRQPGVADDMLNKDSSQFLCNNFRKNLPPTPPEPVMSMINLVETEKRSGEPIMSESELGVFISAFDASGFSGCLNWYRNLNRDWPFLVDLTRKAKGNNPKTFKVFRATKCVKLNRSIRTLKRVVFIITILYLFGMEAFAQSSIKDINKSSWTIYIVEAYRFGEDSKWSNPGIEIKYDLSILESFNMQIRGGYIDWGDFDTRAFPVKMGVSGEVIKSNQFSINPYFISGPSLLIGNDYAGIFATAELGIELTSNARGLSLYVGYGRNMLFHSDYTDYTRGGIGYQF